MFSKALPLGRYLLGLGNRKLGEQIHTFSIPAIKTCPGRSNTCEKACYATRGTMRFAQKSYSRRWKESKKSNFAEMVTKELRHRGATKVRIHCSGDFYSPAYVRKWIAIVRASPGIRFFVYTRSWRVPKIRKELKVLAREKNIRVWYSCDAETGLPSSISRRVRIAYMATSDSDLPRGRPDLVFRVKRTTVKKFSGGRLVCPSENGVTDTTCSRCGICWQDLEKKDARRIALPLAV